MLALSSRIMSRFYVSAGGKMIRRSFGKKKNHLQQMKAPSEQLIFSHGQLNERPAGTTATATSSPTYRWSAKFAHTHPAQRVMGAHMVIMRCDVERRRRSHSIMTDI